MEHPLGTSLDAASEDDWNVTPGKGTTTVVSMSSNPFDDNGAGRLLLNSYDNLSSSSAEVP
jgi:hypothetical protein